MLSGNIHLDDRKLSSSSLEPPARKISSSSSDSKEKICRVCGDRALCVNFSVMSCESCKSFFRRNGSFKPQNFRCYNNGNCVINMASRKACKSCRLAKCLKLGMRISKEKVYNYGNRTIGSDTEEYDRTTPMETPSLPTTIDMHLSSPILTSDLISPSVPLFMSNQLVMASYCQNRARARSLWPQCLSNMSPEDRAMIYELWEAINPMLIDAQWLEQMSRDGCVPGPDKPMNRDMTVAWMEVAHRKLIEVCKRLRAFTSLSDDDQLTLMKYALSEVFFVWELSCYDREKQCHLLAPFQDDIELAIPFDQVRDLNEASYELAMNYLMSFDPDWQKDYTMIVILMALTLFKPRLICQLREYDKIATHYTMYKELLKKYLRTQFHDDIKADYVYTAVLNKIEEIHQLQYTPAHIMLKGSNVILKPLLNELFSDARTTENNRYFNI